MIGEWFVPLICETRSMLIASIMILSERPSHLNEALCSILVPDINVKLKLYLVGDME